MNSSREARNKQTGLKKFFLTTGLILEMDDRREARAHVHHGNYAKLRVGWQARRAVEERVRDDDVRFAGKSRAYIELQTCMHGISHT